jgi:hypothetical protein
MDPICCPPPPSAPVWVGALTSSATFVVGFLTAVLAEPFRQWLFRPKLELEFENSDHFVTMTDEGSPPTHRSRWVRVRAKNRSARLAKACRVYLVGFERRGHSGQWEATEYCDNKQLAWSSRLDDDGKWGALDLAQEAPFFADLLSTRSVAKPFWPTVRVMPYRVVPTLEAHGTYRFTIVLTGDNVRPAQVRIVFKWTGVWDQFEVARE